MSRLPLNVRAALYSLPVFLAWIAPLTWENDNESAMRAGRRSLGLFLLYAAWIGVSYVIAVIPELFVSGGGGYYFEYALFIFRAIGGLGYVIVSLVLAFYEYRSEGIGTRLLPERIADKFESLVSR